MSGVLGRFAPSPSGRMHLGNIFSCLMAWLSARSQDGRILLRIEDLDTARCPMRYAEQMIRDLLWLGLDWDQGPEVSGPNKPYFQSQRTALYQAALDRLEAQGLVYPCFCTRAELHAASAPHREDGLTVYAGTCRNLTPAEREERARRRSPALRLRVPDKEYSFTDGHMGPCAEHLARDCGDFLLRRSDGMFAYQLAVVVDDAAMGVTEVVRGGGPAVLHPQAIVSLSAPGADAAGVYPLPPPAGPRRTAAFQAGCRRGAGQPPGPGHGGGTAGTAGRACGLSPFRRACFGRGTAGGVFLGKDSPGGYPASGGFV